MLTKLIAKYCTVDGVDPSDLQVLKIKLVVKVPAQWRLAAQQRFVKNPHNL